MAKTRLLHAGLPAVQADKKTPDPGDDKMPRLAAAVIAMMAIAGTGAARAQDNPARDYPTRTVTVIVPFAAGGPADITGRIVADIFSRYLGQKFVVENVGGAGGTTGTLRAARSPADGYTILSGHLGTNALAPAFYPSLGYDPQKDFDPIGLTAEYPELLVARRDFPPTISRNLRPTRSPIRTSSMSDMPGLARYPISVACFFTPRLASSRQ